MTIGPATLVAIMAAALATLVWWVATLRLPAWACLFLFGVVLVLVATYGPLVRLP